MDNFVDIWKIFNFAFFDFVIVYKLFWQKIEIPIKDMQGKFTFVKINEKICVLVKKIFRFGGVLFSRRDLFLAKSDLASTIPSNTMVETVFQLVMSRKNKYDVPKILFFNSYYNFCVYISVFFHNSTSQHE